MPHTGFFKNTRLQVGSHLQLLTAPLAGVHICEFELSNRDYMYDIQVPGTSTTVRLLLIYKRTKDIRMCLTYLSEAHPEEVFDVVMDEDTKDVLDFYLNAIRIGIFKIIGEA